MDTINQLKYEPQGTIEVDQPPNGGIFLAEPPIPHYIADKFYGIDEVYKKSTEAKEELREIIGDTADLEHAGSVIDSFVHKALTSGMNQVSDDVVGYVADLERLLETAAQYGDLCDFIMSQGGRVARYLTDVYDELPISITSDYYLHERGGRLYLASANPLGQKVVFNYYHMPDPDNNEVLAGAAEYYYLLGKVDAALQNKEVEIIPREDPIINTELVKQKHEQKRTVYQFHAFSYCFGLQYQDLMRSRCAAFVSGKNMVPTERVLELRLPSSIYGNIEWRIGTFDIVTQQRRVLQCVVGPDALCANEYTLQGKRLMLEQERDDIESVTREIVAFTESRAFQELAKEWIKRRQEGLQSMGGNALQIMKDRAIHPYVEMRGDSIPLNEITKPLSATKLPEKYWLTELPSDAAYAWICDDNHPAGGYYVKQKYGRPIAIVR